MVTSFPMRSSGRPSVIATSWLPMPTARWIYISRRIRPERGEQLASSCESAVHAAAAPLLAARRVPGRQLGSAGDRSAIVVFAPARRWPLLADSGRSADRSGLCGANVRFRPEADMGSTSGWRPGTNPGGVGRMEVWATAVVTVILGLNLCAGIAVVRSASLGRAQKGIHLLIIWLMPVLGAILILGFLVTDRAGSWRSNDEQSQAAGDITMLDQGANPCGCSGSSADND